MNRFAKLILLVALVIAVAVPMSGIFAQEGDELPIKQGTVIAEGGTALYAEPDINSEVLGKVEAGETVYIYEESGLFVRLEGGWTLASQLEVGAAHVNMQSPVDTTRTDLAIRTEPAITADVIKTLPAGTLLGVMVIDGLWAQVYDGEVVGWTFLADLAPVPADDDVADLVQSDAVTISNRGNDIAFRTEPDIQADVVAVVPADTAVHVLAYEGDLFVLAMLEDGTVGWTFTAGLDIEQRAYARGVVNAGPLAIRDTVGGTELNNLPYQGDLLLLGRNEDGTWLQVRYLGSFFVAGEEMVEPIGWVSTDYVDTEYDVMMLPVTAVAEEAE